MIKKILSRVINNHNLHARFLNTLCYLEYVGARKIMKSQHEDDIDERVLEHMFEEIHHAHFLKKIIKRVFHLNSTNFAEENMLAKSAAKKYVQNIDNHCATYARDARHAYLLASYVIETRALKLYSVYDQLLHEKNLFRLTSLLKQEQRHLEEMKAALLRADNLFTANETELINFEIVSFNEFFDALGEEIGYDATIN